MKYILLFSIILMVTACSSTLPASNEQQIPEQIVEPTQNIVFHATCINQQCIRIEGEGADTCTENEECVLKTHKTCSGNSCVTAEGEGIDTCEEDSACITYTNTKHMACDGDWCREVDGPGPDTCRYHGDCDVAETFSICENLACVVKEGKGTSNCATDNDCWYLGCENNACTKLAGKNADLCSTDAQCS